MDDLKMLAGPIHVGGGMVRNCFTWQPMVNSILARNKRKTELGGRLGRRRAGSANGTDFSTSHKAVPIVSSRAKSVDFRVNGMTEFL